MNPSAKTYKSLPHRWIERFSWQDSTNRAPGLLCFKTTKCITNWSYALHNQKINNYNNLGRVSLTFWNSDYSSQHTTLMFFPPSNSGHWCFFIGSGKQRFFFLQANGGELLIFAFGKLAAFALSVALGCIWGSKVLCGFLFRILPTVSYSSLKSNLDGWYIHFTIVYVNIGSDDKSTFSNSILSIPQYVVSMYPIYIYIYNIYLSMLESKVDLGDFLPW